jgi:hypothetical protein
MEENFSLIQYHNWNLSDIESLIPWERETYISMLKNYLDKQRIEYQQAKNA